MYSQTKMGEIKRMSMIVLRGTMFYETKTSGIHKLREISNAE